MFTSKSNCGLKRILAILVFMMTSTIVLPQADKRLKYVNPFIGTTKSGVLTRWGGNGGTYPGAVAPSGYIQVSPETRVTGAKGYDYADKDIYFFSCIRHHSGFPEGSAGRLYIMPVQDTSFEVGVTNRPFDHEDEHAAPGYYRVAFSDDHTIFEAAAATRSAIVELTFPMGVKPKVFIGDAGAIEFSGTRVIRGTSVNTVMNFSEDVLEKRQVKGGYMLSFKSANRREKKVVLKVSTSTVSHASAQENIDKELGTLSLKELAGRTQQDWAVQLATVDIKDRDEENKTIFYTALYHSLLIPWVVSDINGQYRGNDGKVHNTAGKHQYGGFSPWDTFRSLHPLLSLLYPEKQQDVLRSMLDIYKQSGYLPTESMTGNHAVPIIVDSYLKGIRGFDKDLAYQAMKKNIMDSPFLQKDMEIYHQLGYVPFTKAESVTRTVEYAYNDWALGQYAKLVMHNQQDYKILAGRALNYRNLFHSGGLFMVPRNGDQFKPEPGMSGYKEGNKWVYSYFVPHNGQDLVNLMGGKSLFVARLDSALRNDVILYDNETVLHLPYLFNAAGRPDLTQKWIREMMLNRFAAQPGGLPGNDDLGAMSSAYLFNAMGFFPVSPGSASYSLGAPLFQSVTLHLANQKTFVIEAEGQSRGNNYVNTLLLNGQPQEELVLSHENIIEGGTLQFKMSANPNETWPADKNPIALSETKHASNIEVLDFSPRTSKASAIANATTVVAPDEQFWVRFRLHNKGALGTKKVILYVNEKPFAFKHCLVPEGATVIDSIACRLYKPGKLRMVLSTSEEIDGSIKAVAFQVMVKEPAKAIARPFEVSQLTIKPMIMLGTAQGISYAVQNLSGRKRTFKIPLCLGDSILYTDVLTLDPGEKTSRKYNFVPKISGVFTLKVQGELSRFKVYNDHLSSLLLDVSLVSSGTTNKLEDRSGFNNQVRVVGNQPASTAGQLVMLGADTFVEVQSSASLDLMGETLSMMAWVYPKGEASGLVDILTKGDHHVLQTNDNRTLTFFAGGWGRGDCTITLPQNWKNQWHHIAGVCKGDMLWLYIDGKLAGSAKVDGSVNLSVNSNWQIGRNEEFPSERVFHGAMDLVKVYEQPLTPEEIAVLFDTERKILSERLN